VRSRILALALLVCVLPSAAGALEVPPPPKRWVTDSAGILSTTELSLLDSKLESFEQSSGSQFIIYTFPSIENESIEDYTIRAVKAWRVGQAKYDNGLVLFVFVKEKKVRVEVGHGLEGSITDAFSSRLIREQIAPPFQRGAYGEGLNAAADAIIKKIQTGEESVPPLQPAGGTPATEGSGDISPFTIVIILFVVFFIILPMLSRGRRGSSGCGGCLPLFFFPGGGGVTFGGGGFSGGGGFGGGGGFSGGGGSFGGGGATGGW
jgi:uncharacterized protein